MTRDGLVEQNQTTGTEQRISGRLADVSFDKARPVQEATGRTGGRRKPHTHKKQQAKPADFIAREPDAPPSTERFADTVAGGDIPVTEAPASMRDAGDKPMERNADTGDLPLPPPARRTGKRPLRPPQSADARMAPDKPLQRGTKYQQKFSEQTTAPPDVIEDTDNTDMPSQPPADSRERLAFGTDTRQAITAAYKPLQRGTKYQQKFTKQTVAPPGTMDAETTANEETATTSTLSLTEQEKRTMYICSIWWTKPTSWHLWKMPPPNRKSVPVRINAWLVR